MKTIDDLTFKASLEIRVKVTIQSHFILEKGGSLLVPVDENGDLNQELMKINYEACKEAKPLVDMVLQHIKEWKKDGCP